MYTDIEEFEEESRPSTSRRGRRGVRKGRFHNKTQVNHSGSDTEIDTRKLSQSVTRRSKLPVRQSQSPLHRKTESSDSETDEEPQNRYLTRKSSRRKSEHEYNSDSDTEEEVSLPRKSTRTHKPVHRLALTLNVNQNSVQQSSSPKYSSSSSSDTKSDWVSATESSSSTETESVSTSVNTNLRKTRNQGKRTVPYKEYSDEDNNSDSANVGHSVSSRGRLRRATAKAKALWD